MLVLLPGELEGTASAPNGLLRLSTVQDMCGDDDEEANWQYKHFTTEIRSLNTKQLQRQPTNIYSAYEFYVAIADQWNPNTLIHDTLKLKRLTKEARELWEKGYAQVFKLFKDMFMFFQNDPQTPFFPFTEEDLETLQGRLKTVITKTKTKIERIGKDVYDELEDLSNAAVVKACRTKKNDDAANLEFYSSKDICTMFLLYFQTNHPKDYKAKFHSQRAAYVATQIMQEQM